MENHSMSNLVLKHFTQACIMFCPMHITYQINDHQHFRNDDTGTTKPYILRDFYILASLPDLSHNTKQTV